MGQIGGPVSIVLRDQDQSRARLFGLEEFIPSVVDHCALSCSSKGRGNLSLAPAEAAMAELEHCSSCYFPTSWLAVPLIGRREYNHDSTIYTFGLPEGRELCLHLQRENVLTDGPEDWWFEHLCAQNRSRCPCARASS